MFRQNMSMLNETLGCIRFVSFASCNMTDVASNCRIVTVVYNLIKIFYSTLFSQKHVFFRIYPGALNSLDWNYNLISIWVVTFQLKWIQYKLYHICSQFSSEMLKIRFEYKKRFRILFNRTFKRISSKAMLSRNQEIAICHIND